MNCDKHCCWHQYEDNPLTMFGMTGFYCCRPSCKNVMIDQPGVSREEKTHGFHLENGEPKLGIGIKAPKPASDVIWTPGSDPKAPGWNGAA